MTIYLKKLIVGLVVLACMAPAFGSHYPTHHSDSIAVELVSRFDAKLNSPDLAHVPAEAKQLIRDNVDVLFKGTCANMDEVKFRYNQILATMMQHNIYSSPYFYELTDKRGGKNYLLGSYHTAPLSGLCPAVNARARLCSQLWTECDGTNLAASQKIYADFVKKGLANFSLANWIRQLTPEALLKVNSIIEYFQHHHGVDLSNMHPMVFIYIMQEMNIAGSKYAAERENYGIDSDLVNKFSIASKPYRFLETAATRLKDENELDDMIAALRSMKFDDAVEQLNNRCARSSMLTESVSANSRDVLLELAYLFNLADLNEIDMQDNYSATSAGGSVRNLSMHNRNLRWHKVFKKAMENHEFENPNTICVGLAHLPGATGMLPFFYRNGINIKRMDRFGMFTINAYEDAMGRWVEIPTATVDPLQAPKAPGNSLAEVKVKLRGKLTPHQIAAIPVGFNPQVYADLYYNWVATRDAAFQMDELTYATFFYAHFVLPNAKTAAAKLIFMRSPKDAPADFDALRYLQKYAHILAEANDLKIDHIAYAKAHYLHYKDILGVSDK